MGATGSLLTSANMLASAGSAASNAAADEQQASAVKGQATFEQNLDQLNASDAIARGEAAAQQRELAAKVAIGRDRAIQGASGTQVGVGSGANIEEDEARFSSLDASTIRNNAAREAWGLTTQGALGQMAAQNEASSLNSKAYSTLLTGAANTYGIFAKSKANNIWGHNIPAKKSPGPTSEGGNGEYWNKDDQ